MRYYLLFFLFLALNTQAELYKSINPDGSVSYSDTATPNSKQITPPELQTTPAVKPQPKPKPEKPQEEIAKPYKIFKFKSPENDSVVHDNNGDIRVQLQVEPALQTKFKHRISYMLNGKIIETVDSSAAFTYKAIDRGTHTLKARLISETGKTIKSTASITVHLKRHSKLHKKSSRLWPESSFPVPASANASAP